MKAAVTLALAVACGAAPAPAPVAPVDPPAIAVLDHAPSDVLDLDVKVIRWACYVTDPTGVQDDTLHVPTGRPIRLTLHDGDTFDLDVEIGAAKLHLTPGARVPLVIEIARPDTYGWRCPVQEPPGGYVHGRSQIVASPATEYAAYQALRRDDRFPTTREGKIALGKKVVERKGCVACHSLDGTPRVGVSLAGIWGQKVTLFDGSVRVVDAAFIADSLTNPMQIRRDGFPPAMPSFEGQIKPEELDALVAYIESLR